MTLSSSAVSVIYPDSDGLPMSDNTEQFRWIVMIKENLEILFASTLDVFVAGDLLWYPIEGDNKTRIGPDVMVAFGRPKGKRGSYMQWKEQGIAPQVVFEILSPSNTGPEMALKRSFYERHGVEEYYVYDPDRLRLSGFTRRGGQLIAIASMEGWVSPLLGIRFTRQNGDLEIYRPDGRRFLSSVELDRRAEQALDQAEIAQAQAEAAQTQADAERTLRLAAEVRLAEMIEQMRRLGIDPEQV